MNLADDGLGGKRGLRAPVETVLGRTLVGRRDEALDYEGWGGGDQLEEVGLGEEHLTAFRQVRYYNR